MTPIHSLIIPITLCMTLLGAQAASAATTPKERTMPAGMDTINEADLPFVDLGTALIEARPELETKVVMFFDYSCPFCQAVHAFVDAWGRTLPEPLQIEFVHVFNGMNHSFILAAATAYVKESVSAANFHKFQKNVYTHINKTHGAEEEVYRLVREALGESGVAVRSFAEKLQDKEFVKRIEDNQRLQAAAGVTATPTFLIGGRYLTSYDAANGDNETMIKVLNTTTSLHIYQLVASPSTPAPAPAATAPTETMGDDAVMAISE